MKKILVTGPNANNQSILGDWHAAQPEEDGARNDPRAS